jgi:hypothetical protein
MAHLGGGPPFLYINDQPAQTNPTYLELPAFSIPWDIAPTTYLINQPIHFRLDLAKLPVPAEVAEQSTFRWTWSEDADDATEGAAADHTYSQLGSHLVTVEARGPGESGFSELTSVRIQVVESLDYRLPTAKAQVTSDAFASNRPIHFSVKATTDPSTTVASYIWNFGDGSTSREATPRHTFSQSDFLHFVYVQITDSRGYKTEDGLTVSGSHGKLTLSPLMATSSSVPMIDGPRSASWLENMGSWFLNWRNGGLVGILVVLLGVLVWWTRRQRNRTHPARSDQTGQPLGDQL